MQNTCRAPNPIEAGAVIGAKSSPFLGRMIHHGCDVALVYCQNHACRGCRSARPCEWLHRVGHA